jgi:hypothetical protein
MEFEVLVRGLVNEACRLVDSCDDAELLGALARILQSALVVGELNDAPRVPAEILKGREAAWRQLLLYLAEVDGARQRLGPSIAAASVRAVFFWLYLEQWTARLLSGGSGRCGLA